MELFHNLIFGFSVAFSLQNLLYCSIGVLVGTLIGVLPGIYYGAQYGGSTTSILVDLPGRPRRWSRVSTATRWLGRGGPERRSRSRPSARFSPERSAR